MRAAVAADGAVGSGWIDGLETFFDQFGLDPFDDFLIFAGRIGNEDDIVVIIWIIRQGGFDVFLDPGGHRTPEGLGRFHRAVLDDDAWL